MFDLQRLILRVKAAICCFSSRSWVNNCCRQLVAKFAITILQLHSNANTCQVFGTQKNCDLANEPISGESAKTRSIEGGIGAIEPCPNLCPSIFRHITIRIIVIKPNIVSGTCKCSALSVYAIIAQAYYLI